MHSAPAKIEFDVEIYRSVPAEKSGTMAQVDESLRLVKKSGLVDWSNAMFRDNSKCLTGAICAWLLGKKGKGQKERYYFLMPEVFRSESHRANAAARVSSSEK